MATGTLGQGAFICGTPITVQHQKQAHELLFLKKLCGGLITKRLYIKF